MATSESPGGGLPAVTSHGYRHNDDPSGPPADRAEPESESDGPITTITVTVTAARVSPVTGGDSENPGGRPGT